MAKRSLRFNFVLLVSSNLGFRDDNAQFWDGAAIFFFLRYKQPAIMNIYKYVTHKPVTQQHISNSWASQQVGTTLSVLISLSLIFKRFYDGPSGASFALFPLVFLS